VKLIWYPVSLVPLLIILYFSFTGGLPQIVGMIGLFLLFFWVFSFGFAIYVKLRKKPTLRQ
jgi:hypothetical protein